MAGRQLATPDVLPLALHGEHVPQKLLGGLIMQVATERDTN